MYFLHNGLDHVVLKFTQQYLAVYPVFGYATTENITTNRNSYNQYASTDSPQQYFGIFQL
jgi:hypothetical protein